MLAFYTECDTCEGSWVDVGTSCSILDIALFFHCLNKQSNGHHCCGFTFESDAGGA